ncbi:MAG: TIGR02452 family protein [Gemmataceae bacterium]
MNRSEAARQGQEAKQILETGTYQSAAGQTVSIADALARAVAGTRTYLPEEEIPLPAAATRATRFEVCNESTLAAAFRLVTAGFTPAALNFASAKHPGGGFLSGARAQEESLARSSGLVACLFGNPMYAFNLSHGNCLYSDHIIYSPRVPVFRDDAGRLLEQPYPCAFVTSPAVNAKVVRERHQASGQQIGAVMERRMERVLAAAARHEHVALVLGAWGCGVFGNDVDEIAGLFHAALHGPFAGIFERVIFAVLDWSPERRFIGPFERCFG